MNIFWCRGGPSCGCRAARIPPCRLRSSPRSSRARYSAAGQPGHLSLPRSRIPPFARTQTNELRFFVVSGISFIAFGGAGTACGEQDAPLDGLFHIAAQQTASSRFPRTPSRITQLITPDPANLGPDATKRTIINLEDSAWVHRKCESTAKKESPACNASAKGPQKQNRVARALFSSRSEPRALALPLKTD